MGYDVQDRKLVGNEAEAVTVRHIMRRYLELGSVRALKVELDGAGIVSKLRTASDGSQYGGKSFSRGALYLMLQNRVYRGEIVHKGKAYRGEHAPIVDEELWSRVQRHLEENRVDRRKGSETNQPSLLAGILFDASSEPMTPTHAVKKGTRYRYYVSRHLITATTAEKSTGQRIPAANLESLVIKRMQTFVADPVSILGAVPKGHLDAGAQKRLRNAAAALSARWDSQPTEALHGFLCCVIARVQVYADRIDIAVDPARLADRLLDRADLYPDGAPANDEDFAELTTLSIPAVLKRTGKEMKFIVEGSLDPRPVDVTMIRLIVRARGISKRLCEAGGPTVDDVARAENVTASYVTRLVRLTFLAPDIVAAILDGKQPPELTANKLMADTRLPLDWQAQRAALGFA